MLVEQTCTSIVSNKGVDSEGMYLHELVLGHSCSQSHHAHGILAQLQSEHMHVHILSVLTRVSAQCFSSWNRLGSYAGISVEPWQLSTRHQG